ncbi:MAG: uracil-DNA glycosylase [Aquificae bacterium]|nr:uracil-DNA glycosylase [Aquificota bacterium]
MGLKETLLALQAIGFTELYFTEGDGGVPQDEKVKKLKELFEKLKSCTRCPLHESRTQVVPGDGNPYSPVVFVGEAPGEEEDRQGKPFVGRAGQLLNRLIEEELGLKREDVYITNVCKCRPPGNRKPTREEIQACNPYLRKEIEIVKPKVICCLGATAGEGVLGKSLKITKARGQVFTYPYDPKIKVLLTFHPAYVLRNPSAEPVLREDFRKLRELLQL